MLTQREALLAALQDRGWRVARTETSEEWWLYQVVVLESAWAPVGSVAMLVFLVDPLGGARGPASVWAVAASRTLPDDRASAEAGPMLTLGSGWRDRLDDFLRAIDTLRGS